MAFEEAAKVGTEPQGSITDARGRKVTQLDPVTLHMLRRHDVIEAGPLRAIAEAIGPGVSRWRRGFFWVCFCLGLSGLLIALVRAFALKHGLDAVGHVLWLVNAFCLCLGLFGLWQSGRRGRFDRVRRVMLRHHRCPHCGYDISGLPVDAEDGATVCPECGCAWLVDIGEAFASETHA